MVIEIFIKAEEEQVFDKFTKKNTNLIEVASTLLRLKQIENELINIDFDNDLEIHS